MKSVIIAIMAVAFAVAYWQRTTLEELRNLEDRASANSSPSDEETPGVEPFPVVNVNPSVSDPVTDAELVKFTESLLSVKDEFESDRWLKLSEPGTQLSHPVLCETIRRLSGKQIRAVLEAWRAEPPTKERNTGLHRLMLLAGKVNPSETLPLMYELRKESSEREVPGHVGSVFEHWFRMDPDALLKWAKEAGMPTGFDNQCAIWADAVAALQEPTVENVRKFASHKSYNAESAARALAMKLDSQDKRLSFFRSLHEATGGVYDNFAGYMWPLVSRVPFEQLAVVADSVPDFRTSVDGKKNLVNKEVPLGSFRFEIAVNSRDSTAARRWEWLTKREEDRPSDKQLGRLVDEWCESDYPDTASWIRSLPPGAPRDAAVKKVVAFLEYNGRKDLAPEWKVGQPTPR